MLDSDVEQPVNIGNSDEYSVRDLARLVLDVTGSASELRFEPLPVDDPTQRRPDLTFASERLGCATGGASRRGASANRHVLRSLCSRVFVRVHGRVLR